MIEMIADTFAKRFDHWKIKIPEENLKNRRGGYIQEGGWLIQYCFGTDENSEYLDYYAAHRMTDDSHVRIYEDGTKKALPALSSIRRISKDPEEDKRLEDEYDKHNAYVTKMLFEKGFDKFTINMYLHAGLDKEMNK
jgi:hypothetical protein